MKTNIPKQIASSLPPHKLFYDEPMKNHTLIGTGGSASVLLIPETVSELCFIINELHLSRYTILGSGSGVLISDKGYTGIIIKATEIKGIYRYGKYLTAFAGEKLCDISDRAFREGLTGMEWAAADFGTLGAAIVSNTSHFGAKMLDNIYVIEVIDKNGSQITLRQDEINLRGQETDLARKGYTVSRAILCLERGDESLMKTQMDRYRKLDRVEPKATGKVFSETVKVPNPGQLIKECGLAGMTLRGAAVSKKNPNFIVNNGDANSVDVHDLINHITFTVMEKKGVQLRSKIRLLGKF